MKLNKVLLLSLAVQLGTLAPKAQASGLINPFTPDNKDSRSTSLLKEAGNILVPSEDDLVEWIVPEKTLQIDENVSVKSKEAIKTAIVAVSLARQGHNHWKKALADHEAAQKLLAAADRFDLDKKSLLHSIVSQLARTFVKEAVRVKTVAIVEALASRLSNDHLKAHVEKAKALVPDSVRHNAVTQYATRKVKEYALDKAFDLALEYGYKELKKRVIA